MTKTKKPLSPMFKQYNDLKAKHPEAVCLLRCGDFYETYNEDAEVASKVLGLTITRRPNDPIEKMAGFPCYALDTYMPKLIRAGHKVAICDQLEDPKTTKTVKRNILQVATPTVKDDAEDVEFEEVKEEETPAPKDETKAPAYSRELVRAEVESLKKQVIAAIEYKFYKNDTNEIGEIESMGFYAFKAQQAGGGWIDFKVGEGSVSHGVDHYEIGVNSEGEVCLCAVVCKDSGFADTLIPLRAFHLEDLLKIEAALH